MTRHKTERAIGSNPSHSHLTSLENAEGISHQTSQEAAPARVHRKVSAVAFTRGE